MGYTRNEQLRWPTLFILGAPKCGTSNFYTYLGGHRRIFVPRVKEPYFFCDDFPHYRKRTNPEYYRALYAGAPPDALCGNGSVWYLYSRNAVRNIEAVVSNARYFVLIRDPVRAAFSLHGQLLHSLEEDIEDFDAAWTAQEDRAGGLRIPVECREPQFLQYKAVYDYGRQLERLFAQVPRDRVRVYIFEELINDPRAHYRDALEFLGLADDGRNDFPAKNDYTQPRHRKVAAFMRRYIAPIWWKIADLPLVYKYDAVAEAVGMPTFLALKERIKDSIFAKASRERPKEETLEYLRSAFAPTVEATEEVLGRTLKCWCN